MQGLISILQVTIPETGESFALIYSIEDPAQKEGKTTGLGIQVMGPGDSYICQYSKDTRAFWADRNRLALGAILKLKQPHDARTPPKRLLAEVHFLYLLAKLFEYVSNCQHLPLDLVDSLFRRTMLV